MCLNKYRKGDFTSSTDTFYQKSNFKDALKGLRHFFAIENPFKKLKNAFCFTSKAVFVLEIFKFLSWLFGHVAKQFDQKDKVNFKIYDVKAWLTNNSNAHIA